MKLSAIALAGIIATVSAQSLADLPSCAQNCVGNSLPESCGPIDIKCICSNQAFLSGLSCCVAKACSPTDIGRTLTVARGLCSVAGVTNLPTSASCPTTSGGSSGSGTASPTSGATSGPTSGATTTGTGSATQTSGTGSETTATTDSDTATETDDTPSPTETEDEASGTNTETNASTLPTGAAAGLYSNGGLVAGIAALVVALA
ncbi:hypothetical protein FQN57_000922 [Myotisia sp. PD_48]|nr:hypothetical protein FQN57_000922 [Myotisia sp. PD_48]